MITCSYQSIFSQLWCTTSVVERSSRWVSNSKNWNPYVFSLETKTGICMCVLLIHNSVHFLFWILILFNYSFLECIDLESTLMEVNNLYRAKLRNNDARAYNFATFIFKCVILVEEMPIKILSSAKLMLEIRLKFKNCWSLGRFSFLLLLDVL